jgi:2'-5' RNA ligase
MIPDALKDNVVKVQDSLKGLPMDCKMVEVGNLHICLSFLGDIEEKKIKDIAGKLDSICQRYNSGEVVVSGIKLIPSEKYFRVIAFDCQSEVLRCLGRDISKEICDDSYPAHVTLCRVKNVKEKDDVVAKIKKFEQYAGKFRVSSVEIIKSQLGKSGPIYTTIYKSKLLES